MKLRISCIQMDISYGDPEKNYASAEKLIKKAVKDKPHIIVLPELWTTGYDLQRLNELADPQAHKTKIFLQRLAKRYSIHIVGGSVANKVNTGVENTMLIINKDGDIVEQYSKLHLFKLMDEHLYLKPGNSKGLFMLEQRTLAGVICYDIRFPEWIRTHTARGAEALFVVAEWPTVRLDHWRSLLIARAIENQCYVIGCNRSGKDPDNKFAGHSIIIDPWGNIIGEAKDQEEILTAEVDFELVNKIRQQIPIYEDRKPEFYN